MPEEVEFINMNIKFPGKIAQSMKIFLDQPSIKIMLTVMICLMLIVFGGFSQHQNIAGCVYAKNHKGGVIAGFSGAIISLKGISNVPTAISYDDGGFRLNLDFIPE